MLKVTFPGFCAVDVRGDPPGKIHEYLDAVAEEPLKETDAPSVSVTPDVGEVMVPVGGVDV